MIRVYLDNAATTPLDKQVLEEMIPYLTEHFGNPSSIHSYGRKTKTAVEKARKTVATYLNASTSEVFFTGSGTESNNMIIKGAVHHLGVKRIISSRIEHHCVLNSVKETTKADVEISYVNLDEMGHVDIQHLKQLLINSDKKTLVTLMHSNNEIGTLLNLDTVSALCKNYGAYFHSDTVQTIGYYPFDLQKTPIDFLSGSAHKFYGPKGVGFVYINNNVPLKPLIHGGAQERNMRAGTENVAGILGLGKALEIAGNNIEVNRAHIARLKTHMMDRLIKELPGVVFNGDVSSEGGNYKILSVSLPPNDKADLMLLNLDIAGIAASGGSACTSGSEKGSHVLEEIKAAVDRKAVRFSFSKFNTMQEVDYTIDTLIGFYFQKQNPSSYL